MSIVDLLYIGIILLSVYFIIKICRFACVELKKRKINKCKRTECKYFIECFNTFWTDLEGDISNIDINKLRDDKEKILEILVRLPEIENLSRYVIRRNGYNKVSQIICNIYYMLYNKEKTSEVRKILVDYREEYYEYIIMEAKRCLNECGDKIRCQSKKR